MPSIGIEPAILQSRTWCCNQPSCASALHLGQNLRFRLMPMSKAELCKYEKYQFIYYLKSNSKYIKNI